MNAVPVHMWRRGCSRPGCAGKSVGMRMGSRDLSVSSLSSVEEEPESVAAVAASPRTIQLCASDSSLELPGFRLLLGAAFEDPSLGTGFGLSLAPHTHSVVSPSGCVGMCFDTRGVQFV